MAHVTPSERNGGFYEIRDTGHKGRGAFALNNIPAGTRILVEDALFIIEKAENDINLNDVLSKLATLPVDTRRCFESLPFSAGLATSPRHVQQYGRFHMNKFAIPGSGGWGCFAQASRFNKSCLPNCAISTTKQGAKQLYVTQNVSAGEELTFAYVEGLQYMTTAERQYFLRPQFDGEPCLCEVCSLPAGQRELSDMRRNLMRHLLFILRKGMDLESEIPVKIRSSSYRSLPKFKVASEPAGYFVSLAKEEGVGGMLVWNMYAKGASDLLRHFHDKGTRRLPDLAMRTVGLWMSEARRMKEVFMGTTDFARKPFDGQFDQLVKLIDELKQSGGNFDAAGL